MNFGGKSIKNCTTKFRNEFEENSSWLKFGYHGYSCDVSGISEKDFKKYYVETMNRLSEIVGKKSLTTTIRLEKFLGKKENILALKETKYPLTGLLCADSMNRQDYYLSREENKELFEKDYLYDKKLNINLYNTDFRIEQRDYIEKEDFSQDNLLVIFTHENLINNYKEKIDNLLNKLNKYNVKYTFLD